MLKKEEDVCCGRCVPTACFMKRPDGKLISVPVWHRTTNSSFLYKYDYSHIISIPVTANIQACSTPIYNKM